MQTNNATYLGTAQPEQQWAISRMRAIETGKDVVVASTNGISGVLSAEGDVLSRSRSGAPQILVDEVRLGTGVTPGVRIGGWAEYALSLAAAGMVGAALIARRRERRAGLDDADVPSGAGSDPEPVLAGRAPR